MIDPLSIPTDNLYKFQALSGAFLLAFSAYLFSRYNFLFRQRIDATKHALLDVTHEIKELERLIPVSGTDAGGLTGRLARAISAAADQEIPVGTSERLSRVSLANSHQALDVDILTRLQRELVVLALVCGIGIVAGSWLSLKGAVAGCSTR